MNKSWMNRLYDQAGAEGSDAGSGSGTGSLLGTSSAGQAPKDAAPPAPPAEDKGTNEAEWLKGLNPELKDDATLKNFKDINALAAAHVALKKHLGADKVAVPGKHATEEDWKAFYKKVGVPEKIDDYKVEFKKGAKVSEEFTKSFREKLHSTGVLPNQAQALADWVAEVNEAHYTSHATALKQKEAEAIAGLKKEWGNAFEPYVARANKVLMEHTDEDTVKSLIESGLGNDPRLIKLLASIGNVLYKEDKALEGNGAGMTRMTPADARKAAMDIVSNSKHPYHDKHHPNHKAAVEEVSKLFEQAASKG